MFGSAFTMACSLGGASPAATNFSYCRLAVSCRSLSSFRNNLSGSEGFMMASPPVIIRRFVAACSISCSTVTLLIPEASPKLPPLINIIRCPGLSWFCQPKNAPLALSHKTLFSGYCSSGGRTSPFSITTNSTPRT